MAEKSSSDGEPLSGDQLDSIISHGDTMDGKKSTITVRPKSIWVTGKAFKFTVHAIGNDAFAVDRILKAKRLILVIWMKMRLW